MDKWLFIALALHLAFELYLIWSNSHLRGRLEFHRKLAIKLLDEAPDTATYAWVNRTINAVAKGGMK